MKNLKKVLMGLVIVGVIAVVGVIGNFVATENKYYDEVDMVEKTVADFNSNNEGSGAYKEASYAIDWKNQSYGITVRLYTGDGVMISSVSYNNVNDFIENEF